MTISTSTYSTTTTYIDPDWIDSLRRQLIQENREEKIDEILEEPKEPKKNKVEVVIESLTTA